MSYDDMLRLIADLTKRYIASDNLTNRLMDENQQLRKELDALRRYLNEEGSDDTV